MATVLVTLLALAPAHAEVVNRIVATIDGEPVTAREVEQFAAERGADRSQVVDAQLLEALINDRLLAKEARDKGVVVRDEDVDQAIAEVRQRGGLDERQFEETLARQGMTVAEYRTRLRAEMEKQQLVGREIRGRVTVSPEEVERHYEQHKDEYVAGEGVTLRDIVLPVPPGTDPATVAKVAAFAEQLRARAATGEFEALARQFSKGPGAEEGGLLGTFKRGQLDPELERVAFALKRGEVSPVVRTGTGFHILRVDAVSSSAKDGLSQVKDSIREELYQEQLEKRFGEWMTQDLRERHHVEVLD